MMPESNFRENNCQITWNGLSPAEWEARFSGIRRSTLLQSYDYARAVCALNGQKARWGLITIGGQDAGLVQLLEAGLCGNIVHGVILDRGPLWYDGFDNAQNYESFWIEFNRLFPRRFGRQRRIIPEAENLNDASYKKLPHSSYKTVWLDLRQDKDTLRAGLDKKWRNALTKSEKAGLSVSWDIEGKTLPSLLRHYSADRQLKNYDGPSAKLLHHLSRTFVPNGHMMIASAHHQGKVSLDDCGIAAILILCHGTSATYQIGWTSEEGRKSAAHNLLLWHAMCHLKDNGFTDFDLGGINDDATGLAKFKKGTGGEEVTYAGQYC